MILIIILLILIGLTSYAAYTAYSNDDGIEFGFALIITLLLKIILLNQIAIELQLITIT